MGSAYLLALLVCGAAPSGAVAQVDGVEISGAQVAERAAELRAAGSKATSANDALDSLVLDVLLSAEARRLKLDESPAAKARVARERARLAATVLVELEAASAAQPTEGELRRQYHLTADTAQVRVLVFPNEEAARAAAALATKAGSLDAAAGAPVKGFEPASLNGPKIRAQLPPALADQVFTAPLGVPVGPVQLEFGWALLAVAQRAVGDEVGFAQKREQIAAFVASQQLSALSEHLRAQLRRRAKVTVDEPFLAIVGPAATPAELEHVVATVNGEPIRYAEIEPSLRQIAMGSGHAPGPGVRAELLEKLIGERLLEQAAAERKLLDHPSVVARMPALERRALATAMVERIAAEIPHPSEKEIDAFYKARVAPTGQSLEATHDQIATYLRDTKRNEALVAKGHELRAHAHLTVDRAALAQAVPN
jgi:parvulin-like peptidyl-prolyl isomerase